MVRLDAERRVREAERKRCQLRCSMLVWLLVNKRKRHFPSKTQFATSLGMGLTSRKMHKNIFFSPGSRATSSCTIFYLTRVGGKVHLMGLGYCFELSVP